MEFIDRHAVTVKHKQPYAEWANSIDQDGLPYQLDNLENLPVTYLVDAGDDAMTQDDILRCCWKEIFQHELASWCIDKAEWPQRRTLAMFHKWFETTASGVVFDASPNQPL